MKSKYPNVSSPVIINKDLTRFEGIFKGDEFYENLEVLGHALADGSYDSITVTDSRFLDVHMGGSKFENGQMKNIEFVRSDIANARMTKAIIDRVKFERCRMTGFKAIESNLKDLIFKNCQLKLSQFRMSKLKRIVFDNCMMEEADFYNAEMSDITFIDCDLIKSEFSASKLSNVDFRTSKLDGIKIAPENLKGSIIDPSQLPYLGHLLGAKIEWKFEDGNVK